jgi:hypothetical protein
VRVKPGSVRANDCEFWLDEVGRKTRELALRLPAAPGVYRFSDAAGRVLYLGRAVSLRRRVVSYWGDLGDRRHLTPMVARAARVDAVVCDSAHEAARLERNLLRAALPAGRSGRAARRPAGRWLRRRGRNGRDSPAATPNWRPDSFPRSIPRAETTATAGRNGESPFGNSVVSSDIP